MNQPEAHIILQALRAIVAVAAPGVLMKAEAIVPTRELPPYFGADAARECHLAYQSSLMTASWAALAEQRGDIVAGVIANTPTLPAQCSWLNYVRCHDDIGWKVLSAEAAGGARHAPFDLAAISRFYTGETAGSYARGRAFQCAGDGDVHGSNGMTNALVGIAAALESGDANALALAERRLQLLYGVAFVCAGLPLIYMGDEIALGNHEDYVHDPLQAGEGRWLQRPTMDWRSAAAASTSSDVAGRCFRALRKLIATRQRSAMLGADTPMRALDVATGTMRSSLLGIARGERFVALFNFSAQVQTVPRLAELEQGVWHDLLLDDADAPIALPITLAPYTMRWLQRA